MLVRVWEFTPDPNRLDAFLEAYGPSGVWSNLFREAPGFLDVELLESVTTKGRYLTLDRWQDSTSWEAFLHARQRRYLELDGECRALVQHEQELGILRPAAVDDAEAVASMAGELGYPTGADVMRTRLGIVSRKSDELVLVAESPERRLVGWVHVFGAVRLESEPYAEIGGLVVTERARGTGFGHALLASAEAWARARGYADMRIRSNVLRERAHRFYERCGYRSPKSQKVLVKDLRT
jgi:GNAT superfamily N-acetyltransferase/heme-degrading monooxygenase HmoA